MAKENRTVLITGCSDGGLGAALAISFHNAGCHVYATARNVAKMEHLTSLGIETLSLDVQSDSSIAECVAKVPSLDILVNNAGAGYSIPISDMSILEAKKLFDLNVWSQIAVTQAFLPLLLESKGTIVNQTSVVSVFAVPFQSVYNASKAALASFSDALRLELEPFGITVIDLKTGAVASNFFKTMKEGTESPLPKASIYQPIRQQVEEAIRGKMAEDLNPMPAKQYADAVVKDVLRKRPAANIWRGTNTFMIWLSTLLPHGSFDSMVKKMVGLDVLKQKIAK